MRNTHSILLICCLLTGFMVTACGGDGEQKSELDKLTETAENMGKAAEEMGKAAEDMATGTSDDTEPQPAVSFRVLMDYLPEEFKDLERGEPEGESMTMGKWTYSKADISFRGNDGEYADLQIFDYAYIPMLYSSFRMAWKMNYNKESSRGYERTAEIRGYPAVEKWTEKSQKAELNVLVGDRFIVTVKTRGMPESAARELLGKVDLQSLAKEEAEDPA